MMHYSFYLMKIIKSFLKSVDARCINIENPNYNNDGAHAFIVKFNDAYHKVTILPMKIVTPDKPLMFSDVIQEDNNGRQN